MAFESQGNQGGDGADVGPGPAGGYGPPPGYVPPPGYAPAPGYVPPPGYVPAPGYAPPPGYAAPPGYGSYPSGYGYPSAPLRRTDSTAIVCLVLSIVSFFFCQVILAIVALALIPSSRRAIEASGGTIEGAGLLKAAKIVSWINISLGAVAIVAFVILIATSSSSSSSVDFSTALPRLVFP